VGKEPKDLTPVRVPEITAYISDAKRITSLWFRRRKPANLCSTPICPSQDLGNSLSSLSIIAYGTTGATYAGTYVVSMILPAE
jgi:hypothetical protein